MKDFEKQRISIHISYTNGMTLTAMEDSLHILNEAFSSFYEKERIPLSETDKKSPEVVSLSDGSLLVDIIVPVSCALLPVIYDIIKNAYSSKKQYVVQVDETRMKWTDEDNYKISKAVLKEYAVKQSSKAVDDFIRSISLSHIYKKESIRVKVQNTKHLMEEQNVLNTLETSPLAHCSKAHSIQFDKARKDLNI